jgi:hypothetical protein
VVRLQQALIERAAAIVGGQTALGRRLGTDPAQLQRWRAAQLTIPDAVFLQLVDLVLKDDVARARADRRQYARTHALPDQFFERSRDKAAVE